MRQVKFRYWNGSKVLNQEAIINHLNKYIARNDKHLMQFTGLFDKQGVEIYAGDIVKFIPSGEYGLVTTFGKSENLGIEWKNSRTAFFTPMFYLGCETELEIIGNIYEHSHLIDNE